MLQEMLITLISISISIGILVDLYQVPRSFFTGFIKDGSRPPLPYRFFDHKPFNCSFCLSFWCSLGFLLWYHLEVHPLSGSLWLLYIPVSVLVSSFSSTLALVILKIQGLLVSSLEVLQSRLNQILLNYEN